MLWANFAEIDMVKLKKNPGIRRVDCIALAVFKNDNILVDVEYFENLL